jgi:hypothetical protein
MKDNRKILVSISFFIIFSIPLFSVEKEQNISTKIAVIFNTLCAKCHEGQCSGRLSFDSGSEAASSHIKRYAVDTEVSKGEVDEFFTLLNYMKKECALLMPNNGKWKPENLSHFAVPSHDSYFIPLGTLKSGNYILNIKVKETACFRVEVLSNKLNPSLDQSLPSSSKEQNIDFTIDEKLDYFLRIRSRKPLNIETLEIKQGD